MKVKYAIYGLYDTREPETIQYVGCSKDIPARFQTHTRGADKATGEWAVGVKANGGKVKMIILDIASEENMARRESWWISSLNPPLNTNGCRPETYPALKWMLEPMLYWREGNKYFFSPNEVAKFFKIGVTGVRRDVYRGNRQIELYDGKIVKLEWASKVN